MAKQSALSLKKNDCLTLTVTGTDRCGNGIAHTPEGLTVFVRNTCAGDVASVKIIKVLKHYAVAIPEEIYSRRRIVPSAAVPFRENVAAVRLVI